MNDRTPKVSHPVCSRLYVRQAQAAERRGLADQRRRLLAGLTGRVIEVGAGNGLSFAHYPPSVTEVVAVEPDRYLREHALAAADEALVHVTVLDGVAESIPAPDASFDAAVASLVLCSVADPARSAAELFRVVRPGGELRFNEHVASERPALARIQRALDATFWPLVSGGCHLGRDTGATLRAAGFDIESCERFPFNIPPLDPPKSHILGRARRPHGEAETPSAAGLR